MENKQNKQKVRKCPFCGRIIKGENPGAIICPCEVEDRGTYADHLEEIKRD